MEGLNQCTFTGNLVRDAQVRQAGENDVAGFSIAVNGRKGGDTLYVDCSYWRPNKVVDYLTKGKQVLVSGEATVGTYDSKDGAVRATMRLNVRKLLLLGGGGGSQKEEDWGGF
jgi:single-strand DNA-binding protein